MNTEITDNTSEHFAGWIFYDGHCGFCSRNVRLLHRLLARYGWRAIQLQDPRATEWLQLPADELAQEFRILTTDGRHLAGHHGYVHVFGTVWWLLPLHWLCRLPLFKQLAAIVYRTLARNRYRLGGRCELKPFIKEG